MSFNAKKIIILTNLRSKLKQYNCEIESGKIVFDVKGNRTMIFNSEQIELHKSDSVDAGVKSMFLKMAEKQVGCKINIMIWEFSFQKKQFDIEVFLENGTREKTQL